MGEDAYTKIAQAMRLPMAAAPGAEPDFRGLVRMAVLAPSSHNTQPWRFRFEADKISVLPDFSRRCPVVDPDDSHLYKSLGCAAENIVQAAAAQGWGTTIHFDPTEDRIAIALEHGAGASETALCEAITRRQCVRKPYDGRPLPNGELAVLESAAVGDGVRAIMLTSAADKKILGEFLTRGNAVQLADEAYREELLSWMRFNEREAVCTRDGLAARTIGTPQLPSWIARQVIRIALTASRQNRADAEAIESSAGAAVFVAARNDRSAWVEVGRAYERFALHATALDVRTALLNQPIEARSVRPELESWLGLAGERAHLIARFGRGPAVPFSLRRPVDDVIVAADQERSGRSHRVRAHPLSALPTPVSRYLQLALGDAPRLIEKAVLRQSGSLRVAPQDARWRRFEARHVAKPLEKGFVWTAKVEMPLGTHVRVVDSYVIGTGSGRVSLLSIIPLGAQSGGAELNAGALHRYLAESVWFPTALLPESGVTWTGIDERAALATLSDGPTTVSLEFRFEGAGEVSAIYTPGRWAKSGKRYRLLRWEGHFGDYREHSGMRIPFYGEVGWYVDGHLELVWKGRIEDARYTFAAGANA